MDRGPAAGVEVWKRGRGDNSKWALHQLAMHSAFRKVLHEVKLTVHRQYTSYTRRRR